MSSLGHDDNTPPPSRPDCAAYGCYATPVTDVDDSFDVNLANTNARMILALLGLDSSDLCGGATGEDFLAHVLLALATDRDDSGISSAVIGGKEIGQRGATMIDCGLRPGYYAETFGRLHDLAMEAVRLNRDITWY